MKLKSIVKLFLPKYQKLILEYKVDLKPRYGYGKKPHEKLYEIVNSKRENYKKFIADILKYKEIYFKITPKKRKETKQILIGITASSRAWM